LLFLLHIKIITAYDSYTSMEKAFWKNKNILFVDSKLPLVEIHRTIVSQQILSRVVRFSLSLSLSLSLSVTFIHTENITSTPVFQRVIAGRRQQNKNAGRAYFACKFPSGRDPIIFIWTKSDKASSLATNLLQLGLAIARWQCAF